jgi:integrase
LTLARRGDGIYTRRRTWWLDFRHRGKRHVVRLGRGINKTVARELAGIKRAEILKGEAGISRKRTPLSFDKATEDFISWAKANKRPKTITSYRYCISQLKRSFGGKTLDQIQPFLIEKHKTMRVEEDAAVSANRELALLKTLFNRCIAWRTYSGTNPVKEVKLLKEPKGKLRYLDHEEETKLLGHAREPLRTIILVGIYAGLRIQAEALTLKWEDVDFRRGLLTVRAAYAKSGEGRAVNLNSILKAALKQLKQKARGEHVFSKPDGSPYKSIRSAFQTACKRAKLAGVTPHTLRHTFASRLAMAGVDLRTIQELGGWKELEMLQRYSHLSPSHKAEAVEKIAVHFTTLFTTPEKSPSDTPDASS